MKGFLFTVVILCVLRVSSAFAQGGAEWINWQPKGSGRLGPGKIVDVTKYILPVYWERPNREYHVIGYIVSHGINDPPPDFTDALVVRGLVSAAKIHNADAIVMRPVTARHAAAKNSDGSPYVYAWAFAIKWGPPPL